MPKSSVNASLSSYDDIFSTEESRQEEQREQVQQIPIGELFPFKNHPFKVLDDDSMSDTVESVKQYGVLSPLIARPRPKGGYEIISGHRRQHAAELAGLETLPVIVREMSDDAAVILMVDSNLQIRCENRHIRPFSGCLQKLCRILLMIHIILMSNRHIFPICHFIGIIPVIPDAALPLTHIKG